MTAVAARPSLRRDFGRIRDGATAAGALALFGVLAASSDAFLTTANLTNLLDQWSAVGIMACGMTLVVIAGGFDLSIGAIYALAGVAAVWAADRWGAAPGMLLGVGSGLLVGLANGLLTTVGRINPFIGTLAFGYVVRGLALGVTGGFLLHTSASGFDSLARTGPLGLTWAAWAFVAVAAILAALLHGMTFGRHVYATGDNAAAARLAGVRTDVVRGATYVISGATGGLAGVIAASRVSTAQGDAGLGLEFDVFTAVFVGGTSAIGGEGSVARTLIGVAILALIGNGLNLLEIDPLYQRFVFGVLILAAVGLDAWTRAKRAYD